MHVSLLHLNRFFEEDSFKTEMRIRLVDGEDLVQVEFRNTLKQTDGTHLLCKLHLTPFSRMMSRAVSLTYHFKLEHFICSNLLSVDTFWVRYLTVFSQCLANPPVQRSD